GEALAEHRQPARLRFELCPDAAPPSRPHRDAPIRAARALRCSARIKEPDCPGQIVFPAPKATGGGRARICQACPTYHIDRTTPLAGESFLPRRGHTTIHRCALRAAGSVRPCHIVPARRARRT